MSARPPCPAPLPSWRVPLEGGGRLDFQSDGDDGWLLAIRSAPLALTLDGELFDENAPEHAGRVDPDTVCILESVSRDNVLTLALLALRAAGPLDVDELREVICVASEPRSMAPEATEARRRVALQRKPR